MNNYYYHIFACSHTVNFLEIGTSRNTSCMSSETAGLLDLLANVAEPAVEQFKALVFNHKFFRKASVIIFLQPIYKHTNRISFEN